MKLKKLEITGFKSFLEKTKIEFPPGISAIVGPNGCGKSNIVDALRWGMGEQSAKQLRGKAMEDVIFAGSDGKAPISMAEVSITLENDGTAPEELADYSEIMITRKLFRSGERDYLLNKRPCRLKDIQEIFMGSGIGKKPFAIIKQGNVGAIAEATPEERRIFIEEAAGVTRYKTRKEEALRKIKETNENLLRLKDIIGEVKKQMNSLRRQAKAAQDYKTYKQHIKTLEILTSSHYYEEYQNQIKDLTGRLVSFRDTEFKLTTRLKQLESETETIKLEQLEKTRRISEHKSRIHDVQRNIDKAENDLVHFREDIKRLSEEITALQSASETLTEKNDQLRKEVLAEKEQNDVLICELQVAERESNTESMTTGALQEKLDRLNLTIKAKNNHYMELVANEARYKNIYQNAENNKESLQRRLKIIDEEVLTSEKKATDHQRIEQTATISYEAFKKEKTGIEEKIAAIAGRLESKQSLLMNHIKTVQGLETEYGKESSTYQALKKMDDNFEWYKDGVKEIMRHTALQKGMEIGEKGPDMGNILGIMADILTPEPGYETAVESVLGESLQYMLVENHVTGIRFIDHLQKNNSGRSGFIPISAIKQNGNSIQKDYGTADRLMNHVAISEEYLHISKTLLGNVLVTSDMGEAIQTWETFSNNGNGSLTVVTKNGDMISEAGILIGGSQDRLTGILAKKQEIKELEKRIIALGNDIETAYSSQKDIELSIQDIKNERQELLQEKENITQNEIMAEKELYRATEDLKHVRRHFEIVRLEQEQITGEADDIDIQMDTYRKTLETVTGEVKTVHQELMELNDQIRSVGVDLESYQKKIVNLKLTVTELKTKVTSSNQTLRRLEDFLSDSEKRLETVLTEIAEKEKLRESSRKSIRENETALSSLYDASKDIEIQLEKFETDYQSVNDRLRENEKNIESIKHEYDECHEAHRNLELEKSQIQIKQTNIIDRLYERYHQPMAELKASLSESDQNQDLSLNEMEQALLSTKEKIARIGDVNMAAITEFEQLQERFDFLTAQEEDLEKALEDLHTVIRKTNQITRERFLETFNLINEKMEAVFPKLFEGGSARLEMTEPDKPLETGIELMIHPPGKKVTQLSLLSGGEKALSSIAFIFSIFLIKPASFCIMDEIDAPLDDANVIRFNNLLKIIGEQSQIIMITHNKGSMEFADTLFGVTMEKKGISKLVSVNFE